ncbi:TPA: hypothetical protein ACORDH_005374 [Bacillus cereus]
MSNLYKVNASNIIGGAGRLVWVPYGTAAPTKISDVMDTATFELKPSWKDVGGTTEGITVTRGFETEDFEIDQVKGAVDTEITNWTHNISTQLGVLPTKRGKHTLSKFRHKESRFFLR